MPPASVQTSTGRAVRLARNSQRREPSERVPARRLPARTPAVGPRHSGRKRSMPLQWPLLHGGGSWSEGTNGNHLTHGPSTRRGVHQLLRATNCRCLCLSRRCLRCWAQVSATRNGRGQADHGDSGSNGAKPSVQVSLVSPGLNGVHSHSFIATVRTCSVPLLYVGLGESMAVMGGYIRATVGSASPGRTLRAGEP